jgi:hydroxymethylpyrimidine kinase/phosphomethylpyrimidine kinase
VGQKTLNALNVQLRPHLWILSGLDPWGASGLALDIKIASTLPVHICPLVTTLSVQDLLTFDGNNLRDNPLLREQLSVLVKTTRPYGVKVGMLGSKSLINLLLEFLPLMAPVVLDPLTHTSSGYEILGSREQEILKKDIFHRVFLLTPNTKEAEIFTGISIDSKKNMEKAAEYFLEMGCHAVLIKGGHGGVLSADSPRILSLFASREESFWIESPRRAYECRGTGCGLSSLIAGLICQASFSSAIWRKSLQNIILGAFQYLDQSYLAGYHTTQTAQLSPRQPRLLPPRVDLANGLITPEDCPGYNYPGSVQRVRVLSTDQFPTDLSGENP